MFVKIHETEHNQHILLKNKQTKKKNSSFEELGKWIGFDKVIVPLGSI